MGTKAVRRFLKTFCAHAVAKAERRQRARTGRVTASSDHGPPDEGPETRGSSDISAQAAASGLAFQVLAYAPALLVPGVVNFLALALYTRILGSEAYGRYALVVAVVMVVKLAAFDWLRMGLFRFFQAARRDGRLPVLISTTLAGFVIVSLFVVLAWAAVLCLIPFQDQGLKSAMWLGLPLLLVWALFDQILHMNRAAIAPARYGLLSVSRAVLCLAIALCFMRTVGLAETGLILGLIVGTAIPTLVDLFHWRAHVTREAIERRLANEVLRYSIPFVVIFSLDFLPTIANRFLLQHFLGSGAVGLFAAGYDLGNQTITMLFVSLNMAAYPLVVRSLEHAGVAAARAQLRIYSIVLFGAALPGTVLMVLLAQPISALLLGETFRGAGSQLIPWAAVFTFVIGAKAFYFDLAFQLGLRTKLQVWAVAAAALLNIVLGLWWIPAYGLMGAVWATCAAYSAASVISLSLGRRVFPLPFPARDFMRIGLAAILMIGVLLLLRTSVSNWVRLGGSVCAGGAVYVVAIWLLDVGRIRQFRPVATLHSAEKALKAEWQQRHVVERLERIRIALLRS